jgi:hypothetical protein
MLSFAALVSLLALKAHAQSTLIVPQDGAYVFDANFKWTSTGTCDDANLPLFNTSNPDVRRFHDLWPYTIRWANQKGLLATNAPCAASGPFLCVVSGHYFEAKNDKYEFVFFDSPEKWTISAITTTRVLISVNPSGNCVKSASANLAVGRSFNTQADFFLKPDCSDVETTSNIVYNPASNFLEYARIVKNCKPKAPSSSTTTSAPPKSSTSPAAPSMSRTSTSTTVTASPVRSSTTSPCAEETMTRGGYGPGGYGSTGATGDAINNVVDRAIQVIVPLLILFVI